MILAPLDWTSGSHNWRNLSSSCWTGGVNCGRCNNYRASSEARLLEARPAWPHQGDLPAFRASEGNAKSLRCNQFPGRDANRVRRACRETRGRRPKAATHKRRLYGAPARRGVLAAVVSRRGITCHLESQAARSRLTSERSRQSYIQRSSKRQSSSTLRGT
jgi:hypothetical protein